MKTIEANGLKQYKAIKKYTIIFNKILRCDDGEKEQSHFIITLKLFEYSKAH